MSDKSECNEEVIEAFDSFLVSVDDVVARESLIVLPRLLSPQGRRGVSARGLPSASPTRDIEMLGMDGLVAGEEDHNWWYSVLK